MHFSAPLLTFCTLVASVVAQTGQNITVNHNDTTQITYGGGVVVQAPICMILPNGTGQPGCWNVPSHCTDSAAMSQHAEGFASWKFKGSALYITSLLSSISPEFSITIDGKSTDVDGARPELRPYECFSLFSTTGLDPNVEHTVNMTIKGPSPNRDISVPAATIFSLVNYTYTAPNEGTTTTSNGTQGSNNNVTDTPNDQNSAVSEGAIVIPLATVILLTVVGILTAV